MTLRDAIESCIKSSANTNQTGLTLSQTHGWRVTYGPEDQEPGDVGIISKESLTEWLDLGEWTDETFDQCAEWITDNIGEWLDRQVYFECLTPEDADGLMRHV